MNHETEKTKFGLDLGNEPNGVEWKNTTTQYIPGLSVPNQYKVSIYLHEGLRCSSVEIDTDDKSMKFNVSQMEL